MHLYDSHLKLISSFLAHNQSGIERLKQISQTILASCSFSGSIKFWNTTTIINGSFKQIMEINQSSQIYDVVFLDENIFALANPRSIQLFSFVNGLERNLKNLTINHQTLCLLRFNTSILVSGDDTFKIRLWNVTIKNNKCSNMKCQIGNSLHGHTSHILDLALVCETRLASASNDRIVIIWDLREFKMLYCLRGHKHKVTSLRFDVFNFVFLASGSTDGTIKLWNMNEFNSMSKHTLIHGSKSDNGSIYWSLDFFDKHTLVSGSRNGWIKLWDIRNGGELIKSFNSTVVLQALSMTYFSMNTFYLYFCTVF